MRNQLKTIIVEHRHRQESPAPVQKGDNLFIIKCPKGLGALKYWLQKRKFNCFVETKDRNGKCLFGLLWDFHHGTFPSPKRSERGAILVLDRKLEKQAALIMINALGAETDYSKQWRQAQRDLYQYGRSD